MRRHSDIRHGPFLSLGADQEQLPAAIGSLRLHHAAEHVEQKGFSFYFAHACRLGGSRVDVNLLIMACSVGSEKSGPGFAIIISACSACFKRRFTVARYSLCMADQFPFSILKFLHAVFQKPPFWFLLHERQRTLVRGAGIGLPIETTTEVGSRGMGQVILG